ncbi:hypothetical protein SDC9_155351 [bioreactor metagenome]|uniref:Uncharacterized protein n=1 Tax=bioreactor metagenome TaxID=1076179 RepID=A0A645F1A1_9ZZZZ
MRARNGLRQCVRRTAFFTLFACAPIYSSLIGLLWFQIVATITSTGVVSIRVPLVVLLTFNFGQYYIVSIKAWAIIKNKYGEQHARKSRIRTYAEFPCVFNKIMEHRGIFADTEAGIQLQEAFSLYFGFFPHSV